LFWEYDSRIAVRWNIDPENVAFWSPYAVLYGMPLTISDPNGDCPWLLLAALLLTADVAIAPTRHPHIDGPAIAEARRNHDVGLAVDIMAPGIGAVAEKYVFKKVAVKAAPLVTKVTSSAVVVQVKEVSKRILKPVATKIEGIVRPTWQASEKFIGKMLGKDFKFHKVFKEGVQISSNKEGSVVPEYYNFLTKEAIEVKNYNLTTRGGISDLINNVSEQANYRNLNLPAGSSQTVFIDVTGQNATKVLQSEIISRIKEKTKDVKDLVIKFFEQEKGK
jgi:hypothetical protein